MTVRQATQAELDRIEQIYESVHDGEEQGLTTVGWIRNVYPTRKTAEDALDRQDLFVMEDDGKLVAVAVINQIQVDVYEQVPWKHAASDSEVMVLHAFAVNLAEAGNGYGKAFVAFYEEYAREHGCMELRIDTNVRNTRARHLYQKLGYKEEGVVECVFNGIPDVQLVCMEKYLG